LFEQGPTLLDEFIRMVEPERMIQFHVAWVDGSSQVQINRGWRVLFSSALGPYKTGYVFTPL
jgi:glutamate dehydrogenase (NADP+)